MNHIELETYLNKFLNSKDFSDYGPNGIQVQGKKEIKKIVFSVSASKEGIEQAVNLNADALIVHHGVFWNYQKKILTGAFYNRVAPMIKNDLNLYAYHLPLDAHQEVGNAKAIADLLGVENLEAFGEYKKMPLGVSGKFREKITAKDLKEKCKKVFNKDIIHVSPDDDQLISSIGIITGGANNNWIDAKKLNLDAYLTGEISEYNWHDSLEEGIHFFACGHHATEKFGIQLLMNHLKEKFDFEVVFIDSDNLA